MRTQIFYRLYVGNMDGTKESQCELFIWESCCCTFFAHLERVGEEKVYPHTEMLSTTQVCQEIMALGRPHIAAYARCCVLNTCGN